MRKKQKLIATRLDVAVMLVLFCLMLPLFVVLVPLVPEGGETFAALAVILIYLVLLFLWALFRVRQSRADAPEVLSHILDSAMASVLAEMQHPLLLVDDAGRTVYCNAEFLALTERDWLAAGTHFDQLCEITSEAGKTYAIFGERRCLLYRTEITAGEREYALLNFYDISENLALSAKYRDERAVIAYAIIDNIEEILQFVQDNYAATAAKVETALRKWMEDVDGLIRPYDRNKYMLIFSYKTLMEALDRQFPILDDIRSIRVGDGMPITISLGVSHLESATLAEREEAAQYALDLALQRGGDQAVLRTEVGASFFGGRTKASYKRVNIKSRVVASQLMALIGRASNVIVMGHNYGDYDSFASCVGLARLASALNVRTHIAVKRDQPNLYECFERVSGLPEYNGIFVDEAEALDLLGADTLVLLTDVNNFKYVECPAVLSRAVSIAVIDHHIKTVDFNSAVKLEYVDPTASSASELVSEILEHSVGARVLRPEEAELLLSGVLLDTKRFTRNTGTRTFAVAQFLRGAGANPGETFELFKTTPEDLAKETCFNSNVVIYRGHIAIAACSESEGVDDSYRTAAARVADALLGVKGVDVSFALVRIGEIVYISGRSNGTVNVQVMLEQLHGGGHFDVAGAQIAKVTVEAAVESLRACIDEYFDNKHNKGETI